MCVYRHMYVCMYVYNIYTHTHIYIYIYIIYICATYVYYRTSGQQGAGSPGARAAPIGPALSSAITSSSYNTTTNNNNHNTISISISIYLSIYIYICIYIYIYNLLHIGSSSLIGADELRHLATNLHRL